MPSAPKKTQPRVTSGAKATVTERLTSMEAVLRHAPDIGVNLAIKRFGNILPEEDRQLLRSLSDTELSVLRETKKKFLKKFPAAHCI
jgi:hypothetical protein